MYGVRMSGVASRSIRPGGIANLDLDLYHVGAKYGSTGGESTLE